MLMELSQSEMSNCQVTGTCRSTSSDTVSPCKDRSLNSSRDENTNCRQLSTSYGELVGQNICKEMYRLYGKRNGKSLTSVVWLGTLPAGKDSSVYLCCLPKSTNLWPCTWKEHVYLAPANLPELQSWRMQRSKWKIRGPSRFHPFIVNFAREILLSKTLLFPILFSW